MFEKQINKRLRREFRIPGWLLIAYFALMNVLVLVAMFGDMMKQIMDGMAKGEFMTEPDMEAIMGNAWGYLWAVAVAMLFLFVWKDRSFWKEQVFARKKKMSFGLFLILLCVCMAIQFINSFWVEGLELFMNLFDKSILETLESVSGSSDTVSMFLYASFVAPITEELIFRGYIQGALSRYGKKFSILCSALFFGIFHGNLIQTPYAFLVGLVLGYVASEYSIGWAMVLHMINNLVVGDMMTRLTAGMNEMAAAMLVWSIPLLCGLGAVITLICRGGEIGVWLRSNPKVPGAAACFFGSAGVITLTVLMGISMIGTCFVLFIPI